MDEPLAQNLSAVMAAAAAALQKPAAHSFQGPGRQCKVFWQRQFLPILPARNV